MYKEIRNSKYILRLSDGAVIPNTEKNRDYKTFLKWKDEGNILEPAETTTEKKSRLYSEFCNDYADKIKESDQWAILVALGDDYIEIAKDDLIIYKNTLRSIYNSLSSNSNISDLENPVWPEKLTERSLLWGI